MTRSGPAASSPHRRRSLLATAFGILAVVGVLASVLATWSYRSLFRTEVVGRAVDQALQQPEVVEALADHLTEQLFVALGVEALVEERLPAELDDLAPAVVGGLRAAVHEALARTLAEDATRRVLVGVAEQGHRSAMRVLDGGRLSDGVTIDDGTASINLLPILGEAFALVQEADLLTGVDLPRLDAAGHPRSQIRDLEEAFGHPLPPDFGQLTVYDSARVAAAGDLLGRAQQALVLFRRSVALIVSLTVVSSIASLSFAVRRRQALLFLSVGVVAAMAVGRAIIAEVVAAAPGLAVRPGARAAIHTVVATMAESLLAAVTFSLVAALLMTVLAYLTGARGPARSLRSLLQRNRELATLAAVVALAAVLWVWSFSLGPLVLAAAGVAATVVVAWTPPRDRSGGDEASTAVSAGRGA